MANSDQALKRARQAEKRRQQNTAQRSMLRTHVKKAAQAIATGDLETAKAVYQAAMPVVDRLADKGIVHKNKAARHKSRLNARLKALAQARTTG